MLLKKIYVMALHLDQIRNLEAMITGQIKVTTEHRLKKMVIQKGKKVNQSEAHVRVSNVTVSLKQ